MGAPINALKGASAQQLKMLEMPTIESHFPFEFAEGGFRVETLDFSCNSCDAKMDMADVRGVVSNLVPRVLDMNLVGRCQKCGVVTPFRLRVHSDRVYDWQDDHGQWHKSKVYAGSASGVAMAVKDMFAAIKGRFFGQRG